MSPSVLTLGVHVYADDDTCGVPYVGRATHGEQATTARVGLRDVVDDEKRATCALSHACERGKHPPCFGGLPQVDLTGEEVDGVRVGHKGLGDLNLFL